MTEQEIERCLERLATCKATDVMNFDYAGTHAYIKRLQEENAALRERLEEAEIPCHIGDTLYEPFANTMIREWTVDSIYIGILGIDVNCQRKDDYKWHDSFAVRKYYNDFGKRVFLTREAAEARLAELKGGAK